MPALHLQRADWRRTELARPCNPGPGQQGYFTREQTIGIQGTPGLRIRSLEDRNQFHDPLNDAAALGISQAAWPLFGWPWASGVELATRVAARPVQPGERMLEMGCGLALASLTAHRLGRDVTASDLHPLTSRFLAFNLRLNGLSPMKYRRGHWDDPPHGRQAARRSVRGRFEFLVGSDVLYERDASCALAAFVLLHAASRAEVWIVDPDRGNRPAFRRVLLGAGFTVVEERLDRAAIDERPSYKGRLMRFIRT